MKLSVIIPTHRGGAPLQQCLQALSQQRLCPDEVIVVVTNPRDHTPLSVVAWPFRLRVRRLSSQRHYGAAVNAGIGLAVGDELVILNDDTVPHRNFLAELWAARDENGPGLYQPRILLQDRHGHIDNVGHGLFFDGFNWARGREAQDGARFAVAGSVGAVSGAAFWLSRSVLDAVGPFDTDLQVFGEDVDLSLRAVRRGIPLRYVPSACIEHALGGSYGRYGAWKVYLVERNRVRLAVRSLPVSAVLTLPFWTMVRWSWLGGLSMVGYSWGARLDGLAKLAVFAGAVGGLRYVPDALHKRRRDAVGWQQGEWEMWVHLIRERVRLRDVMQGPT